MKKLFVLVLVLAISTMATAATVDLVITAGPDSQGEYLGAPSYNPSDTITIALVGTGFPTSGNPGASLAGITISTATSDGGGGSYYGTASSPGLHTLLSDLPEPGTVKNENGLLIQGVDGGVPMGTYTGVPDGDSVWWFEFHVPDAPWSTIITIDLTGLVISNCFGASIDPTYGGALEIHVVPEPMTIALLGLGGLFLRRRK